MESWASGVAATFLLPKKRASEYNTSAMNFSLIRTLNFRIFTNVNAPEGFTIHDGKEVIKIETTAFQSKKDIRSGVARPDVVVAASCGIRSKTLEHLCGVTSNREMEWVPR